MLPPSTDNNLDDERLTFDKLGPFKEPHRDDVASPRQANVAMFSWERTQARVPLPLALDAIEIVPI